MLHALALAGRDVSSPRPAEAPSTLRCLLWLVLMLMFFQLPYYKPETGPFYGLAKIWPLMLAPLVIYGMFALRLPDRALYLLFMVYALAVTPFLSMLHLPNGLGDAIAAAAKAWPITFYFSAAAALVLLRPSEQFLARCLIGLGVATFAVMLTLWVVVPVAWYQPGAFGSNMFSWDEGRGNYIRMPLMLGEIAVFWLAQRFARERRVLQGAFLLAALLSMIVIYKARLPTGVTLLIVVMVLASQVPPIWRWALGALIALPAALGAMVLGPRVPGLIAQVFDESLFIRLRSLTIAWEWLAEDPLRMIFGGGSISTFSNYTLSDYFRAPDFWLTDIGWLGVLLEYGIIGTALILLIHARALITTYQVQRGDPFRAALTNYVLFEILCSAVYSVMYAPGPVATVAAISWWLALRDRQGIARDAPGLVAQAAVASGGLARPAITVPAWASGRISRGPE